MNLRRYFHSLKVGVIYGLGFLPVLILVVGYIFTFLLVIDWNIAYGPIALFSIFLFIIPIALSPLAWRLSEFLMDKADD